MPSLKRENRGIKTVLVVPCYERVDYLKQCLKSLREAQIPSSCMVILVDDASKNKAVVRAIKLFTIPNVRIIKIRHEYNAGVASALLTGWDYAVDNTPCVNLACLDSDAIVREGFIERLTELKTRNYLSIISGFNTLTADPFSGQPRHPPSAFGPDYVEKNSIGGINILMDLRQYQMVVRPILFDGYGWDWKMCKAMRLCGLHFVCSVPSVVQHIGFDSTHSHLNADIAHDY